MLGFVVAAVVMARSALVRSGLSAILGSTSNIRVVAEVAPEEASMLDQGPIDLVVCDVADDAAPESVLGHTPKGVPVLALAGSAEKVRALLGSGARGVLLRNASAEQLASASLAVASGLVALDEAMIQSWSLPERRVPVEAPAQLTPREQEVLGLMAEGLSNRWIATRLGISEHTVKFHVNSILDKLEADTRTDAVVRAARQGLLTL